MVEHGLRSGRISSSSSACLSLLPEQSLHIVEGRTHTGTFALNAIVQAQLESDGAGTRVQIVAANANGDFDFGAASRFKRRFATYLADFLRVVSADRDEPEGVLIPAPPFGELPPPIASPTHASLPNARPAYSPPSEIEFGPLTPLNIKSSQWVPVAFVLGVWLSGHLGVLGPFSLLALAWKLWEWRQGQKTPWWVIVLFAVVGFVETGRLLQRWF